MITDISQTEIPCFMKRKLSATQESMKAILKEIETQINDLPMLWKMRYPAKNLLLEQTCYSLYDMAHRLESWRKENLKVDEKQFEFMQIAILNRLKSKTLTDAQGIVTDKEQ